MKKLYLFILFLASLVHNTPIALGGYRECRVEPYAILDTIKLKAASKDAPKITDTRINKPDFLKTGVQINITPFKPVIIKDAHQNNTQATKDAQDDDDKILSDVKVYPNPVETEINLSYKVNKESNVTIKIMDVLGNEITTLLSQKLSPGEQLNTFNIASRLSSGFYFIRLITGDEVVIKRISVL